MITSAGQRCRQLIFVGLLVTATHGCKDSARPQEISNAGYMYDFGRVSVDSGPQELRHVFTVTNNHDIPVEILHIKRSCGCLAATLGDDHLEPGESTSLELVLEVSSAGKTSQGATLVLSNNKLLGFTVTAYGTLGLEMKPILRTAHVDQETHRIEVRLYLIDTSEQGETDAPVVVAPADVSLDFSGWITLEKQTSRKLRPTRQIGTGVLDFGKYQGDFPVEVQLTSKIGAECSLTVHAPE